MKNKQSAYAKAIAYITEEIENMVSQRFMTDEDGKNAIDGLKDLSAAEVMVMFKEWKDCE